MSLERYTNTYVDTDGTIADSDDIIAEFDRIEAFLTAWAESIQSIGITDVETHYVDRQGNYDIDPALGLIQSLIIDASISEVNFNILARAEGDPYRLYIVLRFGSSNTRYTISSPAGVSTIFGINREEYRPSQVSRNGYFAGTIIATYGTDALYVKSFSENAETSTVGTDDVLQGRGV